jgi:hypothetical protein
MEWSNLWDHYNDIKIKYNLTSTDIIRQMSSYPYSSYLFYLSPEGINSVLSTRKGTIGKDMIDLLIANLDKTDWVESTATYEDKLRESQSYGNRFISAYVNNEYTCSKVPIIDININIDDYPYNITDEQLQVMFTIDSIVPKIGKIHRSINL